MTLYRILRISGGRRRMGTRVPTPFVGREGDLDVLARRWERVRAGEGQFVLIGGEPGIGKSRLVEAGFVPKLSFCCTAAEPFAITFRDGADCILILFGQHSAHQGDQLDL